MNRYAERNAMDLGRSKEAPIAKGNSAGQNCPSRRFRHARNANGGVDSICRRCQAVIASSADEWSLLAEEERHLCGTTSNLMTRAPEIHQAKGNMT